MHFYNSTWLISIRKEMKFKMHYSGVCVVCIQGVDDLVETSNISVCVFFPYCFGALRVEALCQNQNDRSQVHKVSLKGQLNAENFLRK